MFLYMCSGNQKRVWGSSFSYDGTIRVVRILNSLMSTKFKKLSCHVIAARLSLCLKWMRFIDVSFHRGEGVLEPRTGSSHPRITSVTFCGASTQWLTPGRVEEYQFVHVVTTTCTCGKIPRRVGAMALPP